MTRDEAQQMMSCRLYHLLGVMMSAWRHWRPQIGFKPCSAGFATGGSVSSFEDLEAEGDQAAIDSLEVGWDSLTTAEKTCIEMMIGIQPWVWVPREEVMQSAIRKLEARVRL